MSKTTVQATREAIEAQVAAFLEDGGEVQSVDFGIGEKTQMKMADKSKQRVRYVDQNRTNTFNPHPQDKK